MKYYSTPVVFSKCLSVYLSIASISCVIAFTVCCSTIINIMASHPIYYAQSTYWHSHSEFQYCLKCLNMMKATSNCFVDIFFFTFPPPWKILHEDERYLQFERIFRRKTYVEREGGGGEKRFCELSQCYYFVIGTTSRCPKYTVIQLTRHKYMGLKWNF